VGGKKQKGPPPGVIPIAENRRARHDFAIREEIECGIELRGTEVKSLRKKNVEFADAYAIVKNGEVLLLGLRIAAFSHGTVFNHEPDRTRRLLLHRSEIDRLERAVREKGETLVPLAIYFKDGWAKVKIGIAKGKSRIDKRETIKQRDADRDIARAMRRG